VAQDVRRNPSGDAGTPGGTRDDSLERAYTALSSFPRSRARAARELIGAALAAGWLQDLEGPGGNGRSRRPVQGDDPGFVSLREVAADMDPCKVGIDVGRGKL
jgi:hypothetical protein